MTTVRFHPAITAFTKRSAPQLTQTRTRFGYDEKFLDSDEQALARRGETDLQLAADREQHVSTLTPYTLVDTVFKLCHNAALKNAEQQMATSSDKPKGDLYEAALAEEFEKYKGHPFAQAFDWQSTTLAQQSAFLDRQNLVSDIANA